METKPCPQPFAPKMLLTWAMVGDRPIMPVSRPGRLEVRSGEMGEDGMEMNVACSMYFGN